MGQVAHQSCSIPPFIIWAGARKYNERLMCWDRARKDPSPAVLISKTDLTWGNYYQSQSEQDDKNWTNPENTFPPVSPSFLGSTSSPSLVQRDGELELKLVYNDFFLLCSQGEGSFPCSSVCPFHRRESSINFSSVVTPHKLQYFKNCSSMGPFSLV